jgi:hypothetical protein
MNPWLLLGIGVLWIASLGGVYVKATDIQKNQDTAAAAKVLDAKLKEAEDNWATNYQAQLELEQEKQRNERVRQRHTSQVATALAVDAGARNCTLAAASIGVLRSSIDASNGAQDAAASGGNDGLQPGDSANGRKPVRAGDGAGTNGVDSIGVPTEPQRAAGLDH